MTVQRLWATNGEGLATGMWIRQAHVCSPFVLSRGGIHSLHIAFAEAQHDAVCSGPAEISEPAFALRSGMLSALVHYLTVHVFKVLSSAEGEALIVTALVTHVRRPDPAQALQLLNFDLLRYLAVHHFVVLCFQLMADGVLWCREWHQICWGDLWTSRSRLRSCCTLCRWCPCQAPRRSSGRPRAPPHQNPLQSRHKA